MGNSLLNIHEDPYSDSNEFSISKILESHNFEMNEKSDGYSSTGFDKLSRKKKESDTETYRSICETAELKQVFGLQVRKIRFEDNKSV